jgi:hypothetical protein
MTFFTTAENVFQISARGVVLVLPKNCGTNVTVRVGEKIQLRTPKVSIIDTKIYGVELIKTTAGGLTGLVLPREVAPAEVSAQTEIWLTER